MKRRLLMTSAAGAALALAGCAAPQAARRADTGSSHWSGRLSLSVDSNPPQSFAAVFELDGNPEQGELLLTTPLGNTLGALQWSPGTAVLRDGAQQRRFASIAALTEAVTGAALPIDALFEWLQGRPAQVPGWRAELSQVAQGRLQATRDAPLPTAQLRVVFERPSP